MSIKISNRIVGDVVILDLNGHITLGEGSVVLRDTIKDVLAHGHRKILLNCAGVGYVDSSGNGELTSAFTAVRNRGGVIKLFNATTKLHDLLQITKMYTVWDVQDGEAAALKSFKYSRYCKCPSCRNESGPPSLDKWGMWPEQICLNCNARFVVRSNSSHTERVTVGNFRVITYEGEYVEVKSGSPYELGIIGRMNLFSSSALERAWRAVPSPRRVIVDLGKATDIDVAGRDALLAFLRTTEAASSVALSLEGVSKGLASVFPSGKPVYSTHSEAIAALGELSDMPAWTVDAAERIDGDSAE